MLRHADVWRAVDQIALAHGLSTSGLARRAGLDPTTFNKSKRVTRDGKLRWPSTESIAKVLDATGSDLQEFVAYVLQGSVGRVVRDFPLIGFAEAGERGYFDDAGYPTGAGWDAIAFPDIGDPHAYALEISGQSMQPVYREGDVVLVSPHASVRRGDRVVAKTCDGEVLVKQLRRRTARRLELESLNPVYEDRTIHVEDVEWVARILWASQ